MCKFDCVLAVLLVLKGIETNLVMANENNESVRSEFRYCLASSAHPNARECVGRTALSFLQRFYEKENFTLADNLIALRDDTVASRSLVNFLDTDPVDFRGILENAGAVISQRSLEFHMDTLYPGLMFKIGPTADANSVAQFVLDPSAAERKFIYEEPSTARILTKHYVLPFLLGLKFNLVALVPILFTVICLFLKKSLFIAKLGIFISSILGVGGVAGALSKLVGWKDLFAGNGFVAGVGGIPTPPIFQQPPYAGAGIGTYPGKNTVYSLYDQDELQYISPYKRQDRKVIFEQPREDKSTSFKSNFKKGISPSMGAFVTNTDTDRFYEYEKQVLLQDHNGNLPANLGSSSYSDGNDEEIADILNTSASYHLQNSDNSGWKVLHPRT